MARLNIAFGAHVIGDDDNGLTIELADDWGLEALIQKDALAGSDAPFLAARGNLSGQVSFRSTKSYATDEDALNAFKTALSLVGQSDTLTITRGLVTFTYAGAVLKSLRRASPSNGVRLCLAYTFETKGLT